MNTSITRVVADLVPGGDSGGHAPSRQKMVLIVDDDQDTCIAIADVLVTAGYAVRWHTDAERAFTEMRGWLPNLVICDHKLPGMSGARLVEAMRSSPVFARIPIVVVSGLQPFSIGWVVYLEKPFADTSLLDVVARYAR